MNCVKSLSHESLDEAKNPIYYRKIKHFKNIKDYFKKIETYFFSHFQVKSSHRYQEKE